MSRTPMPTASKSLTPKGAPFCARYAGGGPDVVCGIDTEHLELFETIATEPGAHTVGRDPDGRCLNVFCSQSSGAAVFGERV
jgi:hypothetical protein